MSQGFPFHSGNPPLNSRLGQQPSSSQPPTTQRQTHTTPAQAQLLLQQQQQQLLLQQAQQYSQAMSAVIQQHQRLASTTASQLRLLPTSTTTTLPTNLGFINTQNTLINGRPLMMGPTPSPVLATPLFIPQWSPNMMLAAANLNVSTAAQASTPLVSATTVAGLTGLNPVVGATNAMRSRPVAQAKPPAQALANLIAGAPMHLLHNSNPIIQQQLQQQAAEKKAKKLSKSAENITSQSTSIASTPVTATPSSVSTTNVSLETKPVLEAHPATASTTTTTTRAPGPTVPELPLIPQTTTTTNDNSAENSVESTNMNMDIDMDVKEEIGSSIDEQAFMEPSPVEVKTQPSHIEAQETVEEQPTPTTTSLRQETHERQEPIFGHTGTESPIIEGNQPESSTTPSTTPPKSVSPVNSESSTSTPVAETPTEDSTSNTLPSSVQSSSNPIPSLTKEIKPVAQRPVINLQDVVVPRRPTTTKSPFVPASPQAIAAIKMSPSVNARPKPPSPLPLKSVADMNKGKSGKHKATIEVEEGPKSCESEAFPDEDIPVLERLAAKLKAKSPSSPEDEEEISDDEVPLLERWESRHEEAEKNKESKSKKRVNTDDSSSKPSKKSKTEKLAVSTKSSKSKEEAKPISKIRLLVSPQEEPDKASPETEDHDMDWDDDRPLIHMVEKVQQLKKAKEDAAMVSDDDEDDQPLTLALSKFKKAQPVESTNKKIEKTDSAETPLDTKSTKVPKKGKDTDGEKQEARRDSVGSMEIDSSANKKSTKEKLKLDPKLAGRDRYMEKLKKLEEKGKSDKSKQQEKDKTLEDSVSSQVVDSSAMKPPLTREEMQRKVRIDRHKLLRTQTAPHYSVFKKDKKDPLWREYLQNLRDYFVDIRNRDDAELIILEFVFDNDCMFFLRDAFIYLNIRIGAKLQDHEYEVIFKDHFDKPAYTSYAPTLKYKERDCEMLRTMFRIYKRIRIEPVHLAPAVGKPFAYVGTLCKNLSQSAELKKDERAADIVSAANKMKIRLREVTNAAAEDIEKLEAKAKKLEVKVQQFIDTRLSTKLTKEAVESSNAQTANAANGALSKDATSTKSAQPEAQAPLKRKREDVKQPAPKPPRVVAQPVSFAAPSTTAAGPMDKLAKIMESEKERQEQKALAEKRRVDIEREEQERKKMEEERRVQMEQEEKEREEEEILKEWERKREHAAKSGKKCVGFKREMVEVSENMIPEHLLPIYKEYVTSRDAPVSFYARHFPEYGPTANVNAVAELLTENWQLPCVTKRVKRNFAANSEEKKREEARQAETLGVHYLNIGSIPAVPFPPDSENRVHHATQAMAWSDEMQGAIVSHELQRYYSVLQGRQVNFSGGPFPRVSDIHDILAPTGPPATPVAMAAAAPIPPAVSPQNETEDTSTPVPTRRDPAETEEMLKQFLQRPNFVIIQARAPNFLREAISNTALTDYLTKISEEDLVQVFYDQELASILDVEPANIAGVAPVLDAVKALPGGINHKNIEIVLESQQMQAPASPASDDGAISNDNTPPQIQSTTYAPPPILPPASMPIPVIPQAFPTPSPFGDLASLFSTGINNNWAVAGTVHPSRLGHIGDVDMSRDSSKDSLNSFDFNRNIGNAGPSDAQRRPASGGNAEHGKRQQKKNKGKKNKGPNPNIQRDKDKKVTCRFWLAGTCRRSDCPFKHEN